MLICFYMCKKKKHDFRSEVAHLDIGKNSGGLKTAWHADLKREIKITLKIKCGNGFLFNNSFYITFDILNFDNQLIHYCLLFIHIYIQNMLHK